MITSVNQHEGFQQDFLAYLLNECRIENEGPQGQKRGRWLARSKMSLHQIHTGAGFLFYKRRGELPTAFTIGTE